MLEDDINSLKRISLFAFIDFANSITSSPLNPDFANTSIIFLRSSFSIPFSKKSNADFIKKGSLILYSGISNVARTQSRL